MHERTRIDLQACTAAAAAAATALEQAMIKLVEFMGSAVGLMVSAFQDFACSPLGLQLLSALHMNYERLVSPGVDVEWESVSHQWMRKY